MKTIHLILILLVSAILFQSCLVSRPYAHHTSVNSKNGVYELSAPYYRKEVSAAGKVALAVGFIAGGAAGAGMSKDGAIYYDDKNQRQDNTSLNAVVGAVAGLGVVAISNVVLGQRSEKKASNFNQFLSDFNQYHNKDYILYAGNTVVSKKFEAEYTIENVEDARIFAKVFPNSTHTETKIGASFSKLKREELPKLLEIFPNTQYAFEVKKRYLNISKDLAEILEAKERFKDLDQLALEKVCSQTAFIADLKDVFLFSRHFGGLDKVCEEAIAEKGIKFAKRNELPEIVKTFQGLNASEKGKVLYIEKAQTMTELWEATERYPQSYTFDLSRKSASMIASVNDAQKFSKSFNGNEIHSFALREAKAKIKPFEYPELVNALSKADSNLIAQSIDVYYEDCLKELERVSKMECPSEMYKFRQKYKGKPDEKKLISVVSQVKFEGMIYVQKEAYIKAMKNPPHDKSTTLAVIEVLSPDKNQFTCDIEKDIERIVYGVAWGTLIATHYVKEIISFHSLENRALLYVSYYRHGAGIPDEIAKNPFGGDAGSFAHFMRVLKEEVSKKGLKLEVCEYLGSDAQDDANYSRQLERETEIQNAESANIPPHKREKTENDGKTIYIKFFDDEETEGRLFWDEKGYYVDHVLVKCYYETYDLAIRALYLYKKFEGYKTRQGIKY